MAVTGVTGAGQEVIDEDFAVVDDGDATKKIQWETSGITTGNTIILTAPTSDFNFNNISVTATGTDGELITWDSDGNPANVAVGTATHVLTSNGAGAAPTFQAASAGGMSVEQGLHLALIH